MSYKPKIGLIIGTTRPNRFADTPANWLLNIAQQRDDAEFELVDLRDYPMPFYEEVASLAYAPTQNPAALEWAAKIDSLDGFVFLTAEYNHSISGVLKNALDYIYTGFRRKPAAFLGYGGAGATRAVEHMRHILAELQAASIKHAVHIGMTEMLGMLRQGKTTADYPYLDDTAKLMLDEIVWWSKALNSARAEELRLAA